LLDRRAALLCVWRAWWWCMCMCICVCIQSNGWGPHSANNLKPSLQPKRKEHGINGADVLFRVLVLCLFTSKKETTFFTSQRNHIRKSRKTSPPPFLAGRTLATPSQSKTMAHFVVILLLSSYFLLSPVKLFSFLQLPQSPSICVPLPTLPLSLAPPPNTAATSALSSSYIHSLPPSLPTCPSVTKLLGLTRSYPRLFFYPPLPPSLPSSLPSSKITPKTRHPEWPAAPCCAPWPAPPQAQPWAHARHK